MKKCTNCNITKEISKFYKHKGKKDGLRSHCSECLQKQFKIKSTDVNFKVKRKLLQREYRKNPDFKKREKEWQRKTNFKRSYGITVDGYNFLFNKQNGNCAICGLNQINFKRKLAVDHCHTTKKIRGLLCDHCNPGLGYFKDSEILLNKAIKYLKEELV